MPYSIVREDGERFIVPSYRDVISVRNPSALKKELAALCQSYGDYITVQKINNMRYEAAFSPDPGYLLGESIWYELGRPADLIYCEAIAGTSEAILVIVKNSSVYLDGRFPLESIPEELVIFLTQHNEFVIYTYGNVPISETPEEGKFSFEASSVKSFKVLDKPIFPTLPLIKAYQLQLIDPVLESLGIGVFPVKKVMVGVVIVALLWIMWSFVSSPKEVVTSIIAVQINPFQPYEDALSAPSPDLELTYLTRAINLLMTMPGWTLGDVTYGAGKLSATVTSDGTSLAMLEAWASRNGATVEISPTAVKVNLSLPAVRRPPPRNIYPIKQVLETLTDKLAFVYPGNVLKLGSPANKGPYLEQSITVNITGSTSSIISLIGNQFKDLPLVLQGVSLSSDKGFFSGTIVLKALGS